MLTFDRPSPFSSMGRRSTSNVPAQSLMLMNDPFVIEQTRVWAQQLLEVKGVQHRIDRAFQMAFSRPPTAEQRKQCEAFLHAFTGQPLPNDDDLRKDNPNRVPAEVRRIMEEMGIDPSFENDVSEDD